MTDSQLAAIIARTDAAMGLLISLLMEKGVITRYEVGLALQKALDTLDPDSESALVGSVFTHLQVLLSVTPEPATSH
jgi:hypothetical protein